MDWAAFDIETAPKEISDIEIGEYLASRGKILLSIHPLFSQLIHIGVRWEEGDKHFSGTDEKELLTDFCNFLNEENFLDKLKRDKWGEYKGSGEALQLVTFNGDSFDIPYLLFKSSIYRIPLLDLNLSRNPYREQRTSNHFDCLTFIAGTEIEKKVKLPIACKLMGIEVEDIGLTGHSIKSLFKAEDWDSIKKKNQQDLELTEQLYKKLLGR